MRKVLLGRILGFIFILVTLSISWSISFYVVEYIYNLLQMEVRGLLKQLTTSFLGLFLFFSTTFIITRFHKKMGRQRREFFQSITEAMQQIATGDFNVNLEKLRGQDHPNDPFGEIVDHINDMAKSLGQIEEMRQEFISNVSHEIQSPLTSISGFARALKSEELTQKERNHYLSIIETESKRLSHISDNLLKLTYLEAEQHEFVLKEYRLDRQLQHIILACEPQWQDKDIDMRLSVSETNLIADEELLNQVWINLLQNAIKFTAAHGIISVRIKQIEEAVTVIIADTGIGISEEEKLHLFERFYKADKARNRHTSGSGLGLSIVKKILTLHEATIQVESNHTGTTFYITFTKYLKEKGS